MRESRPFHKIIKDICGHDVVAFDAKSKDDVALRDAIDAVCKNVINNLKKKPILSKRVNEVGNKIEPYVIEAFNGLAGFEASVPCGRTAGYPDILLKQGDGRYTYIECKTYNRESVNSTFRSFFFSDSETFKVEHDARHLVVGFEIVVVKAQQFRPVGFKMVDAHSLPCTLKEEWNSNNHLLYGLPNLLEFGER